MAVNRFTHTVEPWTARASAMADEIRRYAEEFVVTMRIPLDVRVNTTTSPNHWRVTIEGRMRNLDRIDEHYMLCQEEWNSHGPMRMRRWIEAAWDAIRHRPGFEGIQPRPRPAPNVWDDAAAAMNYGMAAYGGFRSPGTSRANSHHHAAEQLTVDHLRRVMLDSMDMLVNPPMVTMELEGELLDAMRSYRERRRAAQTKAKDLFVMVAGQDAYNQLTTKGLRLKGSLGTDYEMMCTSAYCVRRVSDGARLCATVPGVPILDMLLGIKLMIENDEPAFLAAANVAPLTNDPGSWNPINPAVLMWGSAGLYA